MDFTTGLRSEETEATTAADQRGAPRYTSLIRSAKLVCGQGEFVCVIRDVSSTGVSLRTFHALPIDHAIALELQNGERYEMTQVRADGLEASYQFDKPVAVDRLVHENWTFPKRQLRLNIVIPLEIAALTGRAKAVSLNLSQQGARIECDQIFAIDQRVTISCPQLPDIRCTVRWRKDSNYGLVFEDTFSLRNFAMLAVKVQCPHLLSLDD